MVVQRMDHHQQKQGKNDEGGPEIGPHPKGDQSWVFIGKTDAEAETPVLWPPDVKK